MDERNLKPLDAAQAFAACEGLWREGAKDALRALYEAEAPDPQSVIMVLDDDPTGVQTVHDVDVVTRWDASTLTGMMKGSAGMFFVLTNSRSFSTEKTARVHREIAENALRAAATAGRSLTVISRGDSTLRGHYPLETQALRDALTPSMALSGEILCPFFAEGGRFTLDGVHYVREGDMLVPAAQTEFAKDRTFGYRHSYLPDYISEKSGGAIPADRVEVLRLSQLRGLEFDDMERRLLAREDYAYIAADAMGADDVRVLAVLLARLAHKGRRYLLRTAAAVPKALGHISDRPLLTRKELSEGDPSKGGLVIVGSHVQKTTDQLKCLRASDAPLEFIEFDVTGWREAGALEAETRRATAAADAAMQRGVTAVVYTSRAVASPEGMDAEAQLAISTRISGALTAVVSSLSVRPRFLIAKGGITSSDVGTQALGVVRATVLGQAAPGVPVWRIGPESRFPGMAYVIFPGNVGGVDTLREIVERLA
ncbi:MAG: four-carbon acid sugar kinase family protein [Clostridia bacterium]|nr:four-carbon acid sugar kinase family protein [Clostridia bacterium]